MNNLSDACPLPSHTTTTTLLLTAAFQSPSSTAAAMPKLSPLLKSLIHAPHSHPSPLPAPPPALLHSTLSNIRASAAQHGVGKNAWLCLGTAVMITSNSLEGLKGLWDFGVEGVESVEKRVEVAAVMRETGLKCISFSGIPRTINGLGALRAHLPEDVKSLLPTTPTRQPTPSNIDSITARAKGLWDAIYEPHSTKLLSKLTDSHPDLPVHILNSHYGALLSDPPASSPTPQIGRVLTSLTAIACLRTQQGVAPQVISHVFGLMKAGEQGGEVGLEGWEWLVTDEGCRWVVGVVDGLGEVVNPGEEGGRGTFAGPVGGGEVKARL